MNKTGSNTLRLWRTTGIGGIQKHPSNKIILNTVSNRRLETSSRKSKKNTSQENLDKQLTGQISTSPFMNIRDGIERKVSFNDRDELRDKIDKLTVMMSRLAAKDSNEKRPFKLQIYKSRGSHPRFRIGPIIKEVIRMEVEGQTVETGDSIKIMDLDKTVETTIFKRKLEDMEDKIIEENIGIIGTIIIIEVGTDQEKGHSQGIMAIIGIEVLVIVDQDQGLELVLIEIG